VQRGPSGDYVYLLVKRGAHGAPVAGASTDAPHHGHRGGNGANAKGADANAPSVKMQPVTVAGEADDTHEMIGAGLQAGDLVVTEGQFRLKEGSKVTPMKPGEEPKAPTAEQIRKAAQQGGRGRRG
jgi:multidrug efflux system membrane fusion protein